MKREKLMGFVLTALCLLLCLILLPINAEAATVASGTCGDNLTWTLDDQGTLTISGTGAMTWSSYSNAPWYSNCSSIKTVVIENGVTTIGDGAFYGCTGLTSIAIPDSVTAIGSYAFEYCTSLTSVTIPDSVTTIGGSAFYNCTGLTVVNIPDSVTTIGSSVFEYCDSLTSVTIPDSVTTISDSAFGWCDSLTSVTIGNSVTTIGNSAFNSCDSLTSITIPESVITIGDWAFFNCNGLTSVTIPNSVITIGEMAFAYCANLTGIWVDPQNPNYCNDSRGVFFDKTKTTLIQAPKTITGTYSIPDSVTAISDYAFYYCTELTSVTIPDSTITIGHRAFFSCDGLVSITIPDSVTTIGESAFSCCTNLISVTIPDSVTTIGSFAFDFTAWYDNQPDGLIYVGKVAYRYKGDCPTTVTIKDGTLGIAGAAFYGYDGLLSVAIPDSVVTIGDCAFYYCTSLSSVTIPDNVTIIGGNAFKFCINLTSVTIGTSLTTIDNDAFGYCCGLKGILFKGSAPSIGSFVFYDANATAYYPANDPTWTEDVRQDYGGTITWVSYEPEPDIELFDIDVARMILGNSLEFQFGVSTSKFEDITGVYAVVEKGDITKTIPATQWGSVGPYYAIVYDGLAAKEMADEISVTIYNADGDAISNAKTDSVRQYVARAFDGQTAEGKTMMVDMLNYGAAAQVKFNYNTDDLANSQLTDAQKACGTATLTATENIQAKGPNYVGTRLVLESRIQMQVAFSGMDRTMYAIYSYTDHNGTEQNVTVKGEDFIEISGMYGIELSELVYADARTLVTVRVYNADGTLYSGAKDSIQSYVNRSGETDTLFEALMKFTDSAKAYLH